LISPLHNRRIRNKRQSNTNKNNKSTAPVIKLYTMSHKKGANLVLSVTSSNNNRF